MIPYPSDVLLHTTAPLTLTAVIGIGVACFFLRWITNVLANHIPAIILYEWQEEVASERNEAVLAARPSLASAMRETPFLPPFVHSLRKGWRVDTVQATCDIAVLVGPLAIFLVAGGFSAQSVLVALLILPCAIATLVDKSHFLLPDLITLPTIWCGLIINSATTFIEPTQAIWGACFGYLIIWGINKLYAATAGKDGIGLGDAKWLAIPGAWFGIDAVCQVLIISCALSFIYAFISGDRKIAFGPALSVATLVVAVSVL